MSVALCTREDFHPVVEIFQDFNTTSGFIRCGLIVLQSYQFYSFTVEI